MGLSTFLNGRTPATLRGLQLLALTDTGLVLTRTTVSDAGGGATQTWGTAGTVPCRIDPLSNRTDRTLTAGRISERSTHLVTLPDGTTVETDDRFAITGRGTFEVTAVQDRTSQRTLVIEVVQVT